MSTLLDDCGLCRNRIHKLFDIQADIGNGLIIRDIILLHYWYKTPRDVHFPQKVCSDCWSQTLSFHIFYKNIESVHANLTTINLNPINVETVTQETCINNDSDFNDLNIFSDNFVLESDGNEPEVDVKLSINKLDNTDDSQRSLKKVKKRRKHSNENKSKIPNIRIIKDQQTLIEEDNSLQICFDMSCGICLNEFKFNNIREAADHYKKKHNTSGEIRCQLCSKVKKIVRRHLIEHVNFHQNKLFECDYCHKKLSTRKGMIKHMWTYHAPVESQRFPCNLCNKSFARAFILEEHKNLKHTVISNEKHYCSVENCGKWFSSLPILNRHIQYLHENKNIIMCDICARTFRSKTLFKVHMVSHSQIKLPRVECKICNKWYTNKGSLRKHIKHIHHEINSKPMACNVCGLLLANLRSLKHHQYRQHENRKTYDCTICDKSFKRPITLTEHLTTHTGISLYKCEYCSKSCSSHANMYKHKAKNHPEELKFEKEKRYKETHGPRDSDLN